MNGDTLDIGHDEDGPRHYLDGRPVQAGAELELLTPFGWTRGRYEAASIAWPRLVTDRADLLIRPDSLLRWAE